MSYSNILNEIGSQKIIKKGREQFENLAVPFGNMVLTNNHSYIQKKVIDLNSSKTMKINDPLFDGLLNKVSGINNKT
jgi:hypothetical protein